MSQFVVYQITNTVNGKRYIGYTSKTVDKRWKEHRASSKEGSSAHFHLAIKKYGFQVFVCETLFVEKSAEAAQETEILTILDRNPEYNMTPGGDCGPLMTGPNHPLYGKKRPDLSERNRNRVWTEEARLALAEKQTGKRASEEAKLKMSQSKTGKKRGFYTVTSNGVSLSNKKRAGTQAAALAAKKASEAYWAKYRAVKTAEKNLSEGTTSD